MKSRLYFLLFFWGFLLLNACKDHSAELLLEKAHLMEKAGDYTGPIEDYKKALEITPENTQIYYLRAKAKGQLKDWKGAVSDFDIFLKAKPKEIDAYVLRAVAKTCCGDYRGALHDYDMAIVMGFKDTKILKLRVELNYQLKNYNSIISECDSALNIDSLSAEAYYYRGMAKSKIAIRLLHFDTKGSLEIDMKNPSANGLKLERESEDDLKKACHLGFKLACDKIQTKRVNLNSQEYEEVVKLN